jgi:hypothetical protein
MMIYHESCETTVRLMAGAFDFDLNQESGMTLV